MISIEVYQENGYDSREDYLNSLSEVVSNLQDAMCGGWFDETEEDDDDDENADETGG